jgi:hypothetical protein
MLRPYLENPRNGDSSKKTTTSKPPDGFHPFISYASLDLLARTRNGPFTQHFPKVVKPELLVGYNIRKESVTHHFCWSKSPFSKSVNLAGLIASSLNPCKFHLQRYVAKGTQNDQSGIDILSLLRIRHGLRGIRILFFSLLGKSSIQQDVNAGCFPLIPISCSLWRHKIPTKSFSELIRFNYVLETLSIPMFNH